MNVAYILVKYQKINESKYWGRAGVGSEDEESH